MTRKEELNKIGLTADNSIIAGLGILNALNIRENKDIDIVVTENAYTRWSTDNRFHKKEDQEQKIITDDLLEISMGWNVLNKNWKFNDFLEKSIVIDNIRHLMVDFRLEIKRSWLLNKNIRQKDIDDVKLIESYLKIKSA